MSTESPNKHIVEYLNGYIEKKDIDHAVMINGHWGCGKTHFIKDYIENSSSKKDFCHISLYGITKTSDINNRIFFSLHPKLTGKKTRIALLGAAKVISVLPYVQNLPKLSAKDISGFLTNKIFIFDDFERCILSPVELLGYVNSFVEHDHIPTIILANESEMFLDKTPPSDENKSLEQKKYDKTREKLIGKTFSVKNDNKEIVPKIINRLDLIPEVKDVLQKNIDLLFKLLDSTKKNNYRALQHCIRDFDHICDYFDKELMKDEEFLKMMDAFFSISYEVQINNVTFHDLKQNPYTISLFSDHGSPKKEKTQEEQKVAGFYERHPDLFRWNHDINWEDVFNFTNINQLVSVLDEKIAKREPHIFEKLWWWYKTKQEDLDKLILEVESEIEQKTFKHPAVILHIFSTFCSLSQEKLYPKTLEEIRKWAVEYISNIELEDSDDFLDDFPNWNSWGGLGFQAIETEEVKYLLKLLTDKTRAKLNSVGLKYYKQLLKKLEQNDSDISNWLDELRHNTLFSKADPALLLETLISEGPKVIMDNDSWIKKRVIEAGLCGSSKVEDPFWIEFKKRIIEYLKTAPASTTKCAFKRLLKKVYDVDKDELKKEIKASESTEEAK